MGERDKEQSDRERLRRLEASIEVLRHRLDALEETVGGLDQQLRQMYESEDIGVTE